MYTIHEVVAMTGVSRTRLRHWRRSGMLPPPVGGRRYALYSDEYVRTVQRIKDEWVDARPTRQEYGERLAYEREQPHRDRP